MTDRDDIDMLAAEYVLGTLDAAERAEIAARRMREPVLDEAIAQWDRRMSPLLDHVEGVQPSADLFARIEARIDAQETPALSGEKPAPVVELASVRRQLARWRMGAIGATAIAAALAGFILLRPPAPLLEDQKFFAVFQKGDQLPDFLLSIDMETRQLTIRPVDATSQPGKTYQLWIVAEELGPAPRSLGLIGGVSQPTQKQLADYDPAVLETATFGISIEPEGGSPDRPPDRPGPARQALSRLALICAASSIIFSARR